MLPTNISQTASIVANQSAAAGFPTWRYFYNATFANLQPAPNLGVYHSSEIPIVFGTFDVAGNSTATEYALSRLVQKAWADFAKDPLGGPGWPEVGSSDSVAVLGTAGGMGINVIEAEGLDARCALYAKVYAALGVGA